MVRFLCLTALSLLAAIPAIAQIGPDICAIPLTTAAFNRTDLNTSIRQMSAMKAAVCTRDFESATEASSAAQNSGLNVGYAEFKVGASDARQTASGKWSLKDSSMCSANAEELAYTTDVKLKQTVADAALSAWSRCVEKSSEQRLYFEYELRSDGTGFSSTIVRTVNRGGFGAITGIIVSTNTPAKWRCTIGTTEYQVNTKIEAKPFESTRTPMFCFKPADDSARLTLNTSVDSPEWIAMPSKLEIADAQRVARKRTETPVLTKPTLSTQINYGREFAVRFDALPDGRVGTIFNGRTLYGVYTQGRASWRFWGPNNDNGHFVDTYYDEPGTSPLAGDLKVWGAPFSFNEIGAVMYKGQRVGIIYMIPK